MQKKLISSLQNANQEYSIFNSHQVIHFAHEKILAARQYEKNN